jgi:hypothetical protein
MPSLVPVLCNVPWAQKDAVGCEYSAKGENCANHVPPLCPEIKFSSYPRKVLLQVLETRPTLYWHNSSNFRVVAVVFSPMSSTKCLVLVYTSPISLVKRIISDFFIFFHKDNTTQQSTIPVF